MPKQVDRQSLLKRWSELAPKECNKSILIDEPKSDVWAFNGDVYVESDGHFFPAILLAALIQAIRTRGWTCEIKVKQAAILILVVLVTDGDEARIDGATEPCDALLGAYVQALEAANAT